MTVTATVAPTPADMVGADIERIKKHRHLDQYGRMTTRITQGMTGLLQRELE